MSDGGPKPQLPRWAIIGAVVASAAVTGYAMWRTQGTGPQFAWDNVESAVGQVWAQPGPAVAQPVAGAPMTAAQAAQAMVPTAMATGPVAPAMPQAMSPAAPPALVPTPVARVLGAPPILWGTNRPHGDRGSCTQCHQVLRRSGRMVPTILSSASMPHGFRGICSNCHSISGNGPVGPTPVAMVQQTPGAAPPAGMQQAPAGAQPQEVEWRGLEARGGATGVMVSNVEGTARRAGVQPGDVLVSLNGSPVATMAQLEALTMNGTLPRGTLIVRRSGQRLAFEINPDPAAGVNAPPNPMAGRAMGPG